MSHLIRLLVIRMLAGFVALLAIAPAIAAPAKDWSLVATRTPSGSFVQGNPQARIKLIEYLSLTCPHCAHFEAEATAALAAKYIRPGLVSYEVRIALRDPFDLVAAVLARCSGPRGFFAVLPALYAKQEDWVEKGAAWGQNAPDLQKIKEAERGRLLAGATGLDAFFAAHGLPAARANLCLADVNEQRLLSQRAQQIWDQPGFPGTPAFSIDGVMTPPIGEWSDLDKQLGAALRRGAQH